MKEDILSDEFIKKKWNIFWKENKLKKVIIIILIIVLIIFFVIGVWYPVTRYSFDYNSGKIGHLATSNPSKIIDNSPEEFETPFSIFYFWESIERSFKAPTLSLLINGKHESFYLYYIDYSFKGGSFRNEINREFIIDFNDNAISNESWIFAMPYYLDEIDFGRYFSKINHGETFSLNTKLVYKFDNQEKQIQELNYKVTKSKRIEHFSPLGVIAMIIIYSLY